MTLKLGLYTLISGKFFFYICGPVRGMYTKEIGSALLDYTTSHRPPSCKQLSPINLIKWSD